MKHRDLIEAWNRIIIRELLEGGEGSGDLEGHPFRGNQYTGGEGASSKNGSFHVDPSGKGTYKGMLYRGGPLREDLSGTFGAGYYFTSEKEVATAYALPQNSKVISYPSVKVANLFVAKDFDSVIEPVRQALNGGKGYLDLKKMGSDIRRFYKEKGYSGIAVDEHLMSNTDTIVLFDRPVFADKKSEEKQEGGPGSGHFGHAGRPGLRGGSAKGVSVVGTKEIKREYRWEDGSADKLWDELKAWGGARGTLASATAYQITKGLDDGFLVKEGAEVVAAALTDAKMLKSAVYLDMLATKRPGFGKRCMAVVAKQAAKIHKGVILHALPKAVGFYEAIGMKKTGAPVKGGLTQFVLPYEGCVRLAAAAEAEVPLEDLEPDDGAFCRGVKAKEKMESDEGGYFKPHYGRPGEVGGSLPRDSGGSGKGGGNLIPLKTYVRTTGGEGYIVGVVANGYHISMKKSDTEGRRVYDDEILATWDKKAKSWTPYKRGNYEEETANVGNAVKLNREWNKNFNREKEGPFWDTSGEKSPKYVTMRDQEGKLIAGATTVQKGLQTEILSIASHSPEAGKVILDTLKKKNIFLIALASSSKSKDWFLRNGFSEVRDKPGSYNVSWKRPNKKGV